MPDRPLNEIGLGIVPRTVLYVVSLLPLVGLVIGFNYSVRINSATQAFGRRLFYYALVLHLIYVSILCPATLIWVLEQA